MKKKNKENLNRTNIILVISIVLLLSLYIIINFSHIVVYLILLVLSALLHYRHYKGFPKINFGHIFFIAFILDWHDGIAGEILFIILAGLIPEILAGSIELKTFIAYPLMAAVISLPIFLIHGSYILMGIITSIIYYIGMYAVSIYTNEPLPERIFEIVIPAILNIIYFMYLAIPLYSLLDFIV